MYRKATWDFVTAILLHVYSLLCGWRTDASHLFLVLLTVDNSDCTRVGERCHFKAQ